MSKQNEKPEQAWEGADLANNKPDDVPLAVKTAQSIIRQQGQTIKIHFALCALKQKANGKALQTHEITGELVGKIRENGSDLPNKQHLFEAMSIIGNRISHYLNNECSFHDCPLCLLSDFCPPIE